MEKVQLIVRVQSKPGKEAELRKLLQGMLAPTHQEPGCELYELYEAKEPGRFFFYEIWASQEALESHAASAHFQHLDQTWGALVAEPAEINFVRPVAK